MLELGVFVLTEDKENLCRLMMHAFVDIRYSAAKLAERTDEDDLALRIWKFAEAFHNLPMAIINDDDRVYEEVKESIQELCLDKDSFFKIDYQRFFGSD